MAPFELTALARMSRAEIIHFLSEGARCEADLYRPSPFVEGVSYPALVIGHGFSMAMAWRAAELICEEDKVNAQHRSTSH
jgi:hypothetical protein